MATPPWDPRVTTRRLQSAAIDWVVWVIIVLVAQNAAMEPLYRVSGGPTGPARGALEQELTVLSFGVGILCADLYLALSNGLGQSVGKRLRALQLVTATDHSRRPGLVRGLVRSSLQLAPWLGIAMTLSGAHDAFAGTAIISVDEWSRAAEGANRSAPTAAPMPGLPAWKVGLAIVLHLVFPLFYMLIGAI